MTVYCFALPLKIGDCSINVYGLLCHCFVNNGLRRVLASHSNIEIDHLLGRPKSDDNYMEKLS